MIWTPQQDKKVIMLTLLDRLLGSEDLSIKPRPFHNHAVCFKTQYSAKERLKKLSEVGMNVFWYPAQMVTGCDMLSDSGTTSMTAEQWSALTSGDEAYGANRGFFALRNQIRKVFGNEFWNEDYQVCPNAFIFHQGRTAENALFSQLGALRLGSKVVSNGHFDTTRANVLSAGLAAIDLFSPSLNNPESSDKFKGNIDLERLEELLRKDSENISLIILTITNNIGGGQAVSIANIASAAEIAGKYGVPLFFDACRFAENAYFIKRYEDGYSHWAISDIVKKMFDFVDGFTISFKKDGLANMGGGLFFRENGLFYDIYREIMGLISDKQIRIEGHSSYGGMSGRDLMALVEGLKQVTEFPYLDNRISQVKDFGESLVSAGIPVVTPIGGHAVYLDVNLFFQDTKLRTNDFGGVALAIILLGVYGHRAAEIGAMHFGTFDKSTGVESFPEFNYLRFAIPRLRYEKQDLDSVVEALKILYERRHEIPAIDIVHGKDLPLRAFKARFRFREN